MSTLGVIFLSLRQVLDIIVGELFTAYLLLVDLPSLTMTLYDEEFTLMHLLFVVLVCLLQDSLVLQISIHESW